MLADSSLFDAVDCGIIVLNHKGEIVTWNAWMERYSFIRHDKAMYQPISLLFPDMSARLQQAVGDALSLGLSSVISARLGRPSLPLYGSEEAFQLDQRVLQSLTIRPVKYQHQDWCLFQVSDATSRDRHEISLKRTALEIDTMVARARE